MNSMPAGPVMQHELQHLRVNWWWFAMLGGLLTICGTAAIVFPWMTVLTSLAIAILLGLVLMVAGAATIVGAFWAGRWSGLLVQLLVGILYVACGLIISDKPVAAMFGITLFIAVSFIVMGIFRSVAALVMHFPQWGWALLNGVVTLLAGLIIYRNLPEDAFWVIGLLVGLEMLFNGWTWIMLAFALRNLPKNAA